ncbi:MAG: lysozyme inhibitor LprI family protein [Flavobacterium sp.]
MATIYMNKIHLFSILFLITLHSNSQESKTIQKLDTELQNCLDDTQNNMMNCTFEYYTKIDDLLNVTYKKIRAILSKPEQEKLKRKQLVWLKKRDLYFKKIAAQTSSDLDGDHSSQDYRMIYSHENALFLKDRIIELEKYLKIKKP